MALENDVTNGHLQGSTNGRDGEYEIPNLYHSEVTKPIKVVCVGSGISGMCLAFRMLKRVEDFELVIYEKNEDIGGT